MHVRRIGKAAGEWNMNRLIFSCCAVDSCASLKFVFFFRCCFSLSTFIYAFYTTNQPVGAAKYIPNITKRNLPCHLGNAKIKPTLCFVAMQRLDHCSIGDEKQPFFLYRRCLIITNCTMIQSLLYHSALSTPSKQSF